MRFDQTQRFRFRALEISADCQDAELAHRETRQDSPILQFLAETFSFGQRFSNLVCVAALGRFRSWAYVFALATLLSCNFSTGFACADEKTWTYEQRTGKLLVDGKEIGKGYSGNGEGLNNPKLENKKNVGPIPRGKWSIGEAFKHDSKGPLVMKLTPVDHNAHGRDGFLIHGDNDKANKSASEGCIILSKDLRKTISESKITKLIVIE